MATHKATNLKQEDGGFEAILDVMVWVMTPTGTYICILGHQLMELLGKV